MVEPYPAPTAEELQHWGKRLAEAAAACAVPRSTWHSWYKQFNHSKNLGRYDWRVQGTLPDGWDEATVYPKLPLQAAYMIVKQTAGEYTVWIHYDNRIKWNTVAMHMKAYKVIYVRSARNYDAPTEGTFSCCNPYRI